MNPKKVVRQKVKKLTDLPNIGPSLANDLQQIGIETPEQLIGKDAFELYEMLCEKTGAKHDLCVLDVFMSITDFMNGGEAKVWWDYTDKRKSSYNSKDNRRKK